MKAAIVLVSLLVSSMAFASNGLDGRSYCRETGPGLGQSEGSGSHCISFRDGLATDNANTHFGNAPETLPYEIAEIGDGVIRVGFGDSRYILAEDGSTLTTVKGSATEGTVLTLVD